MKSSTAIILFSLAVCAIMFVNAESRFLVGPPLAPPVVPVGGRLQCKNWNQMGDFMQRCDTGAIIIQKKSGTFFSRSTVGDNSFIYRSKWGTFLQVSQSGAFIYRSSRGKSYSGPDGSLNGAQIINYANCYQNWAVYGP